MNVKKCGWQWLELYELVFKGYDDGFNIYNKCGDTIEKSDSAPMNYMNRDILKLEEKQ